MTAASPASLGATRSTDAPNRLDQHQVGGDHYSKLKITPWQALEAWLTPEEFRGYLKGEAIVYIARERDKAGPVDIGKARHVLQKLEEVDKALAAALRANLPETPEWPLPPPVPGCMHCPTRACARSDSCPYHPAREAGGPATGQTAAG
jgi:hypothetical protein